jgi:putative sigma-54 modulation protein
MNINITFRHMEPSDALKSYVETKLEKLNKFIHSTCDVHVVLSVEKRIHQKADIQLVTKSGRYTATHEEPDMYASIDLVVDKLTRQVQKKIDKTKSHKGDKSTQEVVFTPNPESVAADEAEALGEI